MTQQAPALETLPEWAQAYEYVYESGIVRRQQIVKSSRGRARYRNQVTWLVAGCEYATLKAARAARSEV